MANVTLYLPKSAKNISLTKGDKVTYGQILVKGGGNESIVYDIAKLFSIEPSQIETVVTKQVGQSVIKGEIIAKKKGVFSAKTIHVPFDGKIIRIDTEKGQVEIGVEREEETIITSPVDGVIAKVEEGEITINFDGELVFAKQGIGQRKKGKLITVGKENQEVSLADINTTQKGTILLVGSISDQVLEKTFGLEVLAVVTTALTSGDLSHISQKQMLNPSVAIISPVDYKTLLEHAGRQAVVEGEHKRIIIQN